MSTSNSLSVIFCFQAKFILFVCQIPASHFGHFSTKCNCSFKNVINLKNAKSLKMLLLLLSEEIIIEKRELRFQRKGRKERAWNKERPNSKQ
jgi:hypothetical protein